MISYEEFAKMDLRVGKILKVERVPNSDKLYVLTVDLGDEKRTIVSGLVDHYAPEDLLGRNVVVIANLQARKIRGIVSQGMLLAAEKDGVVSLLEPDREVPPGTPIH